MVHAAWSHNTICELVLIGSVGSQQVINIHSFEASAVEEALFLTDTIRDTSAQALRDDWITNCLTAYRALHGSGYSLLTVGSQVVEKNGSVSFRLGRQDRTNSPLPAAGTHATAGGMLPYSNAAVLRQHSLLATRHARGRTFIGGLAADARDLGPPVKLSAAYVALMNAYGAAMLARYQVGGAYDKWNWTVYSRPYDAPHGNYPSRAGGTLHIVAPGDYDGDSNFITGYFADETLRTQRRREVGVGA